VTPGAALAFQYLRQRTRVATDAPGHLEWLRECLEPHFAPQTSNACDWNVTFSSDPERYGCLTAQKRAPSGETLAFFTLDSRLVRLPRWNGGAAGDVVAFDDEFDVFYRVSEARREVDVVAKTLRPWGRVALLRVVRELAMEEAVANGCMFLHAAAFECDGVAYAIAGPKHAGKTTLLVHALASGGARFIANDRALLDRSFEGTTVRGMPTLVNVRAGTRATFAHHFDPHGYGPDSGCLTRAEHEAEPRATDPRRAEPMILSPRQFADALGVSPSTGGRLGAILFPVISSAPTGIDIVELSATTARDWLAAAVFPSVSRSGSLSAFCGSSWTAALGEAWLSDLAAQRIPMLRCTLGANAYRPGMTNVLEALQTHAHG
jgi:hypothetical protein